ncbi:MAG TPA: hypothetical protein VFG35_27220, partial [Actinoplanes sp.]|nr:hypothetical protein [Actinoplanes sp.]
MTPRGADRPDDDADPRDEQGGGRKGRRFGRGRPEPQPDEPAVVGQEETGWLDDLRTAKERRGAIGPGTLAGETRFSKSGRVAPGPDDAPVDDFPALGADSGAAQAPGWQGGSGEFRQAQPGAGPGQVPGGPGQISGGRPAPASSRAGVPPQGVPPRGAPAQNVPPRGAPPQNVPPPGAPSQGVPPRGAPPQGVPPQGVALQGMPPQGVPQRGVPPQGMPQRGGPQQGGPGQPGPGQLGPGQP